MPQLKPSFIEEIRSALGKSWFTPDDFRLELSDTGRTLARIIFLYKPEYVFAIYEDEKEEQVTVEQKFYMSSRTGRIRQTVYSFRMVPGRFKLDSGVSIGEIGAALEEIPKWCENIRADLYALAPKSDPLTQWREQLNKAVDDLVKEPETYFDADELQRVDERFDKLYEDVAKLRQEHSLSKQQLEELRKELGEFKASARVYPKGLWARATSNRLVKATGKIINSPEGRTFLFQQIRKALGFADDA